VPARAGTVDSVLDIRVYRAAFVPALVALFLAAFSLADRPASSRSPLAADAFDGAAAFGDAVRPTRNSLNELARTFPQRAPGSSGDAALADRVAATLGAKDGRTHRAAFSVTRTHTSHDGTDIETVVGLRPGRSNRRIVVIADRDARGRAGLSATAAMLELARLFRQRDLRKTFVLVSTTGATRGYPGERAWAQQEADSPVDAVLVLGDLAGRTIRKPFVVPWSTGSRPAPLALQRTVEAALRGEVEPNVGGAHASGQWIRRAVPLTVSGQGVLVQAGLPAVFVGASGERGPAAREPVTPARLREFGRGVLRAVTAIDAVGASDADESPFARSPDGIVTVRNVLPSWAVRIVIGTLLLPALLTAIDAWFRARRRKLPVERWAMRLGFGALPVVIAWAWLRLLGATGALDAPAAPVMPDLYPFGASGAVAIGSTVLVVAAAWFGLRRLLARRLGNLGSPAGGGLAAAVGLVISIVAAAVWVPNPYAAALLLPAAHLWLLAGAPESKLRGALGFAAAVLGAVPPVLVAVHYARALGLDPLELAWLTTLVTADGHISLFGALVAGLWLACFGGVLTVLRVRGRAAAKAPPERIVTRGPAGYAGPGSLGGTESALRR
jgi:hypothetical protein